MGSRNASKKLDHEHAWLATRPGLVLPFAGAFPNAGSGLLLAWKPTRESARALSASIPLLSRAVLRSMTLPVLMAH
jgi:hypothetical protein